VARTVGELDSKTKRNKNKETMNAEVQTIE
jgi:hypothetical protein